MEGADESEGRILHEALEADTEAAAAQPLEIERKFLVDALPDSDDSVSRKDVVQGYLAIEDSGIVVRLRRMDNRCFQTVKGAGYMVRVEREIEMTPEQFGELWPATNGRRVEKTRYEMPLNGLTIELDVYHGWLQGLYTAEVEFKSITESETFVPPAWFGPEVTNDHRYKNSYLALNGIPQPSRNTCP